VSATGQGVVVTGMGATTPLGGDVATTWDGLLAGRSGVSTIDERDSALTITHNLRTAIVDPKGRLVKIYSGNDWRVADVLADLREANGR